jgi:hypothetical protein
LRFSWNGLINVRTTPQSRRGNISWRTIMGKEQYDDIKKIYLDMATVIEKFPDSLKEHVFQGLLKAYAGHQIVAKDDDVKQTTKNKGNHARKETNPRNPKKSSETYKIDRDLLLNNNGKGDSFKEFYQKKKPSTNAEFNTVAIYYLTKIMNLTNVSYNQIYTCYKEISKKTPEAFKQSFTDTKNKQGYIDISDDGVLSLSLRGENFVEHDLPTEKKKK